MSELSCARERFTFLQSWYTKGIWIIPGVDLRVQIVEWDKLLEFVVSRLLLHSAADEDFSNSLGKVIHIINARSTALQTPFREREIKWAHRMRNKVVHDLEYDFSNPKHKEDTQKAIEILESTCEHILKFYELENDWEFV